MKKLACDFYIEEIKIWKNFFNLNWGKIDFLRTKTGLAKSKVIHSKLTSWLDLGVTPTDPYFWGSNFEPIAAAEAGNFKNSDLIIGFVSFEGSLAQEEDSTYSNYNQLR